jgi:glutathione synthase/RimK-type ligase-like ATP-grasp enzyme
MYNIAIVTQREYVNPTIDDDYHGNILLEDNILIEAIQKQGLNARRVAWDDSTFDWSKTSLAVIRATWDYFHRIDEFKKWLLKVKEQTTLVNPYSTINWNLDKRYLRDLSNRDVNIPETQFIEQGDKRSLSNICTQTGWNKWVLKPAISGAARHTYLIDNGSINRHESLFKELVMKETMLLQRYQPSVTELGEWTLVLINGKYTHAVLKKAKPGDFRVQDDFGGTVHDHIATPEEIAFAEKAMSVVNPVPMYGRVDIIRDVNGNLAVQELELIEPELWFRNCPQAATLLAGHLANYLPH